MLVEPTVNAPSVIWVRRLDPQPVDASRTLVDADSLDLSRRPN
jgi:hypothetical protein